MFLNLNWYGETSNCCLDVNPNSNGKLSPNAVVEQKDFIQNSFLFAKPAARDKSKKGGTVYTRNIKLYNICVNACSTNEQEQVLSDRLKEVHLEIMQLGATGNGNNKSRENSNNGSIASLAQVDRAGSYARQKPLTSPSRYTKSK